MKESKNEIKIERQKEIHKDRENQLNKHKLTKQRTTTYINKTLKK